MIAVLFCAATLWTDLAYRRVPNALLAAVLVALSLALLTGNAPEPAISARLLGAGLGAAVTLPVYALGRMAAGDVKFLAVAGLFTGPQGLVTVWVVGSLLGLVHAVLAYALDSRPLSALRQRMPAALRVHTAIRPASQSSRQFSKVRGIPYAAYLAAGMLVWMGTRA
ncbi:MULTISPECIES: A24 family peptidase [Cupriavidus]|uniref:Peptidase A24A, prepilin type IV n=1 Tax=Cupriavidus pinatubonensis (strain JMP 134 / LMG 1197) TaxID=264198 RepID=Q46Q33_CUPPJ|nr:MULTISPECIES: prepilin peptidase [Cupriavidus]QYY27634.1 prepilin peptidase [Cupriavidus pinatubonensis]TPQ37781.1 peptidase [Cupriavidus pinatubonensis]